MVISSEIILNSLHTNKLFPPSADIAEAALIESRRFWDMLSFGKFYSLFILQYHSSEISEKRKRVLYILRRIYDLPWESYDVG